VLLDDDHVIDVGEEERVAVGLLCFVAASPEQVGVAGDVAAVETIVGVEVVVDSM
jgi:hypothetical protein